MVVEPPEVSTETVTAGIIDLNTPDRPDGRPAALHHRPV
jgi:hypothetical protein